MIILDLKEFLQMIVSCEDQIHPKMIKEQLDSAPKTIWRSISITFRRPWISTRTESTLGDPIVPISTKISLQLAVQLYKIAVVTRRPVVI